MDWVCGGCSTRNDASSMQCLVCGAAPAPSSPVEAPTVPTVPLVRGGARQTAAPDGAPATRPNRPVAAVPAYAAAPAAPTPAGGPRRMLPIVAALLVVIAAIVGGVVLATRSSDGGSDASADQTTTSFDAGPADSSSYPVASDDAMADEPSTSAPPPLTSTALRTARLNAGEAVLRTGPSLGAGEMARLSDRTAGTLEVLEEATQTSGWYRVRVDGSEGYLFGAFVEPPGPGLCVATYRNTPSVSDGSGNEVTAEKSGTKVLVIGNGTEEGYQVLLPGGQTGWVYALDAVSTSCHEEGE